VAGGPAGSQFAGRKEAFGIITYVTRTRSRRGKIFLRCGISGQHSRTFSGIRDLVRCDAAEIFHTVEEFVREKQPHEAKNEPTSDGDTSRRNLYRYVPT